MMSLITASKRVSNGCSFVVHRDVIRRSSLASHGPAPLPDRFRAPSRSHVDVLNGTPTRRKFLGFGVPDLVRFCMPESSISIGITTKDRWNDLAGTLDTLERQGLSKFETIVIDDGSRCPMPEAFRLFWLGEIRTLRNLTRLYRATKPSCGDVERGVVPKPRR